MKRTRANRNDRCQAAAGRTNVNTVHSSSSECPTQVKPEIPRKALQEGVSGVVKAQAVIHNGQVKEVTILSGPRIFHNAVRAAMMQYKCQSSGTDVVATQEFDFKVD